MAGGHILACGALWLATCCAVTADTRGPWRTCVIDDMESGITGWRQSGRAAFAHDTGTSHSGTGSGRITVTEPAYQLMSRTTTERIFAGDRYRASIWVRTRNVSDAPGAYLALEFLDHGRRLAIAHSQTGAGNGRDGWEQLTAEGLTPKGCDSVTISAVLHAKGTAWFDDARLETDGLPAEERPVEQARIRIDSSKQTNPNYIGFGFHVFFPMHVKQLTPRIRNEVLYKRWKELRPSFARLTHKWQTGEARDAELVATMKMMQSTDTRVYLTTWDTKATLPGPQREAYAREVAGMLEEFRKQGCSNLEWYCLANELSLRGDVGVGKELTGWACLRPYKDVFKDYHTLFHAELKRRNIHVGLLAMDASPGLGIGESRWARQNMDDITAAYGGHHYINNHGLDDLAFYNWFLGQCRAAAAVAPDKPYLIGEFGAAQHHGSRYGFTRWDGCRYYDTPQESLVAIQVAEAVLAAVNGGINALAYWTFSDFPDDYQAHKRYVNKWGTSRWSNDDHSTRDLHYGLAQLTRNLRGPAAALHTVSSTDDIRAASVRQTSGAVAIAIVNRAPGKTPIRIEFDGALDKPFRKYLFDTANPPRHPFGDLPAADAVVGLKDGSFTDELPPASLTVYTTDYDDEPPPGVPGVRVDEGDSNGRVLRWSPVPAADLCYYRIFSGQRQLGSTVATEFSVPPDVDDAGLRVVAVDTSGNAGE